MKSVLRGGLSSRLEFLSDLNKSSFPRRLNCDIQAMRDLTNPRLIKLKGVLFLFIGISSSALLLLDAPRLKIALLLALAIWSFCRFYYFAFYVIEHYVDPSFRFAGLLDFVRYLLNSK